MNSQKNIKNRAKTWFNYCKIMGSTLQRICRYFQMMQLHFLPNNLPQPVKKKVAKHSEPHKKEVAHKSTTKQPAAKAAAQKIEKKESVVQKAHHDIASEKIAPKPTVSASREQEPVVQQEPVQQVSESPQASKPTMPSTNQAESNISHTAKQAPSVASEAPKSFAPQGAQPARPPFVPRESTIAVEPTQKIEIKPMTVGEFTTISHKPVSDVILYLLKKGIVANKNQVISREIVTDLAKNFGLEIIKPEPVRAPTGESTQSSRSACAGQEERLPVVVVVGHVDHGKTTLLDFIRKTRVASREKGGITQHVGAYQAYTPQGSVVFLDTPGHEAFSLIRVRGVKVADIAVVVIAADDGVMPQTVEAIKLVQQAQIPLIVALNKIDKVAPQQVEKVKQSLAQYGLVPEEWGGNAIIVPISAKQGTGIDALLEMLVLQAQVLELKTSTTLPVKGFVLEAKVEKGLGSVATVICQQGVLRIGDYFVAGAVRGRVTVLVDSAGNRLKEVCPSVPVIVAGFEELARAGDPFEVVPIAQYKKDAQRTTATSISQAFVTQTINAEEKKIVTLVIKADNVSSLEAVMGLVQKLAGKGYNEFKVIHCGVGSISESDVMLAVDAHALVYGLHVKIEPNAQVLMQQFGLPVKVFDIIYKLIEELELVAERGRPLKMVTKKVGEAIVIKVFDIKGLGIIAGAQIKTGIFARSGRVAVWRGRQRVGGGPIKSLQRDKKPVKEVHTGYECAFLVDGFTEWEPDDRVECFIEVPEQS